MNHLELTVELDVIRLPRGFYGTPEAIAEMLKMPIDSILCVTLFRANGGFVSVITSASQRLNLRAVMHALDHDWVTCPNNEEWRELGAADRNNPFVFASDPRVETIIDAKILQQKEVAFPIINNRIIKVAMSGLIIGTRARVIGGISLPKTFI